MLCALLSFDLISCLAVKSKSKSSKPYTNTFRDTGKQEMKFGVTRPQVQDWLLELLTCSPEATIVLRLFPMAINNNAWYINEFINCFRLQQYNVLQLWNEIEYLIAY